MKKHIPNILTLGNLLCGCLGIIHILEGRIQIGILFVFPALILDFLDGFVARLLKVSSPIGKQLDSLADMITFGFLPGILLFNLLRIEGRVEGYAPSYITYLYDYDFSLLFNKYLICLIFPLFAALRLAKFNVDETQSDSFIGIPTPAATMFVIGLFHLMGNDFFIDKQSYWIIIIITILISLAMVAPIRMLNLKFKSYGFKKNIFRYLLILSSVVSIAIFHLGGLAIAILLYMVLSIIKNMVTKTAEK